MLLIRDADSILTLDGNRRILPHHSLLIEDGLITKIAETAKLDHNHLARALYRISIVPARALYPNHHQ